MRVGGGVPQFPELVPDRPPGPVQRPLPADLQPVAAVGIEQRGLIGKAIPGICHRAAISQMRGELPWLQVDGGISLETIALASRAGADTFVAGSAIYKAQNPAEMIAILRVAAEL